MTEELLQTVMSLGEPKVLVVGDLMLDSYVYGDALRISPEAPVPVLKVVEREYRCGGAGSVAVNVAALGGRCVCLGVGGTDSNGQILKGLLEQAGVDLSGVVWTGARPTIHKQRLIGLAQQRHRQQLIRVDEEITDAVGAEISEVLLENFRQKVGDADIVCLQDYNKGLAGEDFCRRLIKLAAAAGKKVLVDPPRIADYSKFGGAFLITPNRHEASTAAGVVIDTIEKAQRAGAILMEKIGLEAVVITLDKEGAYLRSSSGFSGHIPTVPRSVYDVTGAGDMVLAVLAVATAAGVDLKRAVELANIAGGLEVEKFGASTVSIEEIAGEIIARNRAAGGKLRQAEALARELEYRRQRKETIVFTNGCFDVLHRGHIEFLRYCRAAGDVVVLGLNSDSSIRQIKGPGRPVNNQFDRAAVLGALETVDYIVIFNEPDPMRLIGKIRPDVLVKGADWKDKGVVGREIVESWGGKVVLAPLVDGKSTTNTINRIKSLEEK